jgi:hypothetical protein
MPETHGSWLARVAVEGCEQRRAEEIGELAVARADDWRSGRPSDRKSALRSGALPKAIFSMTWQS